MRGKTISAVVVAILIAWLAWTLYVEFFRAKPSADSYKNITDVSSAYNADAEIAAALNRLKSNPTRAGVITAPASSIIGQRQIALTFDGLSDRVVVQKILDLLEKHKVRATFFVDGMQTAEDPQAVVIIRQAGHKIENYTLQGLPKMETLPVERLVKDFCRSQKIVKVTSDQGPNLLRCNETNYTERVLQVANACGFKNVVKNELIVTAKTFKSEQSANEFYKKIHPGSIISVKLSPGPDLIRNEHGAIDLKPAIDKQPGLKVLPQPMETGEREIVVAVDKLLTTLNREKYSTTYLDLTPPPVPMPKTTASIQEMGEELESQLNEYYSEAKNMLRVAWETVAGIFSLRRAYAAESDAKPAQELKRIFTTERALSYTFSGVSNEVVAKDVLERLNRMGIKGTFFIMETEMRQNSKIIRKIMEGGHEIGIAIPHKKEAPTLEATRKQISSARKMLQTQFGVKTNLVKQTTGAVDDVTLQAVASLGCIMVGSSINVVQSKHRDFTSAQLVIEDLFPKSLRGLARGQIVHFRMDFYTDPRILADLTELIKQRKVDNIAFSTYYDNPENNSSNDSRYFIKPVGSVLGNKKYVYRYPADPKNIPPNLLKEGPAYGGDSQQFLAKVSKYYIGNPNVNDEDRMTGFSRMSSRRMDKTGVIKTTEKVIFLTFDDWGTDVSINKLLYVLHKHNVTGTFFIITKNVPNNPNLLRAIAVDGHEIGSHSEQHQPMAYQDEKTQKQVQSHNNKAEYTQELTRAFHTLRDVTGDVSVNGKPALTRMFRPPQLAISKLGLEAAFDAGYEYIVSGKYSTEDYAAKDVADLVNKFKDNIYSDRGEVNKGLILVMHMSDTSPYTAVSLDILLTANAAKADTDPSKFKVGRLSEYLSGGYTQFDRKKAVEQTNN